MAISQDQPQEPSDISTCDTTLREDLRLSSRQLGKPHPGKREEAFGDGFDYRKERPSGANCCGKRSPGRILTPRGFSNWLRHKREFMGSGTKRPKRWSIGPKGVILSTFSPGGMFMTTHTSRVTFLLLKTCLKESSIKNLKPDSCCLE